MRNPGLNLDSGNRLWVEGTRLLSKGKPGEELEGMFEFEGGLPELVYLPVGNEVARRQAECEQSLSHRVIFPLWVHD